MKCKLSFITMVSAGLLLAGCASQEDMLHADLWSGNQDPYITHNTENVQDPGKTPRAVMLEQRRLDEERKESKSLKDDFIDGMIDGALEELLGPE